MSPPGRRTGPEGTTPQGRPNVETVTTTTDQVSVPVAADVLRQVADMLAESAEREAAAWREGYRWGWCAGYDVGERAAEDDMARLWRQQYERVRAILAEPTYDELARRRSA